MRTLSAITGLTIRPLDFSDDRLAAILRYLNQDEFWQKYEQEQGKHLIRAYDLSTEIGRKDATTASSHIEPKEGSLFQLVQEGESFRTTQKSKKSDFFKKSDFSVVWIFPPSCTRSQQRSSSRFGSS